MRYFQVYKNSYSLKYWKKLLFKDKSDFNVEKDQKDWGNNWVNNFVTVNTSMNRDQRAASGKKYKNSTIRNKKITAKEMKNKKKLLNVIEVYVLTKGTDDLSK